MNLAEFYLSIPILIQLYTQQYYQDDLRKTVSDLTNELNVPKVNTYDFIIVGGGTAGCVLAGRLSKDYPSSKVLLLEAGGTPPPASVVPNFATRVAWDPDINYFFPSVPMTNASLENDGIVITHTGKMLGGSGSHNDMVHNRGSPKDYDNWATITNDSSWTYANVLQYFKKSETFIGVRFGSEDFSEFYGHDGPITVDTNVVPILPLWFAAGQELGYDIGDPNALQKEGFYPLNKAISEGRRSSTYTQYVENWENDPLNTGRLTVARYAKVEKILLDNDNKAYGVAYTRHGFPQIAHASKEVIVSAGAFSSPLLLMKSGIGPSAMLTEAGIPVKVPLESVGKNMGEHVALTLSPFRVNDTSLFPRLHSDEAEELFDDYHTNRLGILSGIYEGPQCFIVSSKGEANWPDVWLALHPHVMTDDEPQVITFYVVLGRPQSRGELLLNTTAYREGIKDDEKLALIDFKLLTHPDDVEALVEGIKFAFNIAENTTVFQRLDMTYDGGYEEACRAFPFRSDDYWKCCLKQRANSWIHMVGTCSMGPESGSPNTSVVDSKFRVRGVTNLRVVDGSIIPEVTNANLNAPIIMIAEKAADEIGKTWYP